MFVNALAVSLAQNANFVCPVLHKREAMTSQALFQQAVALHQQGRFAEADVLYRRLLVETPVNFQVQYRLGLLLFQQQRLEEALVAVRTALAFHPNQPDALMLRGSVLSSSGWREEALGDFDSVLAQRPNFPGALFNRALVLLELGRNADAVSGFDRFLAHKADSVDAWVNRGVALQGLGRADEAFTSYERALKLNPSHGQAWHNRGVLLQGQGRFHDALECFDKALAQMPGHAGAWRGRGAALMRLLRFDEALKSFDRVLEIVPGDRALHEERATLAEAMRLFAEMPPGAEPAVVWHHRAAFLQILYRLEDALHALGQALASEPNYAPALMREGQVLTELKRTEDGMASYRRHAEIVYGGTPVSASGDPDYKMRHDAEQREFLAAHGIHSENFYLDAGARVPAAINPANAESVAMRWRQSDPKIVVIDNLLTREALEGLRRFCRVSTLWRRCYKEGYLGAMPEYGFACPLLAQIADELGEVFPSVIGGRGLRLLWGFKYDSRLSGIPVHADQAAVNANFWIAPEEANCNPESGGLLVWPVKPPPDWNFSQYNTGENGIRTFLAKEGVKPIVIPHRANRAVVFDSDLFHETDKIEFAEGYLNRRINVTMLYGRRTYHGG
jgi:tetratricopeptide (TPR) repeat protein